MVQKAGQVAHPSGICARSRTMIESLYAWCDMIRMLSRPLAVGWTTFVASARMINVLFEANNDSGLISTNDDDKQYGDRRTEGQIRAQSSGLVDKVDLSMRRIVERLPVKAAEEVLPDERISDVKMSVGGGNESEAEIYSCDSVDRTHFLNILVCIRWECGAYGKGPSKLHVLGIAGDSSLGPVQNLTTGPRP